MIDEGVEQADVAIVGAGVTGLTAAYRLAQAGRRVVVLEARDRVGGRLWTDIRDGVLLELGGQWVSPDQTALLGLVDELGLKLFSRYRDGAMVYVDAAGRVPSIRRRGLPGQCVDVGGDHPADRVAGRDVARHGPRCALGIGRRRGARHPTARLLAGRAERGFRGPRDRRHVRRSGDARQADRDLLGAAGAVHGLQCRRLRPPRRRRFHSRPAGGGRVAERPAAAGGTGTGSGRRDAARTARWSGSSGATPPWCTRAARRCRRNGC